MGKEKRLCFSLHVIRCNLEEITLSCPILKSNIYRIKHYILFKFADSLQPQQTQKLSVEM